MQYYTYQHRSADTNEIFYVGKGKGTRLNQSKGRNDYWHRIVDKHGFIAKKIADNLDEELAFLAEMECIDAYRRRGIQLVNATDGGEGASGYKHSEEHKESLKGNSYGASAWGMTFKGKKHTEESKEKMRKNWRGGVETGRFSGEKNPMARKCVDFETGTIYGCVKEMANALNIPKIFGFSEFIGSLALLVIVAVVKTVLLDFTSQT